MSIDQRIRGDIFTLVIKGLFNTNAFFDALEAGMTDRRFRAPMRALVDARMAQLDSRHAYLGGVDRPYAEIRHCFIPHWAMVAASDGVLFGIAGLICTISDLRGVDMRAYEDIDEARCRLTWSNFYQQDPFCRILPATCRPHFVRPVIKA